MPKKNLNSKKNDTTNKIVVNIKMKGKEKHKKDKYDHFESLDARVKPAFSVSRSLSDTELTKDIIQLILSGDLTGNFAQVMKRAADVQCQQIARNMSI